MIWGFVMGMTCLSDGSFHLFLVWLVWCENKEVIHLCIYSLLERDDEACGKKISKKAEKIKTSS